MRRALLALLLSACGRVGFDGVDGSVATGGGDARGDSMNIAGDGPLAGHDEDSDGIPDSLDLCPHIADTPADTDGDLVGDACDREPLAPNQQWMKFVPCTSNDPDFARGTNWVDEQDSWQILDTTGATSAIWTMNVTDLDVWIGFQIDGISGGGSQAAIVIRDMTNTPYYYGELYDAGGSAFVNLINYDGSSYNAIDSQQVGTTLPLGNYVLHVQASAAFLSEATIPGSGLVTTNAATAYASGQFVLISFGNLTGKLHWIAIVGS